MAIVITGSRGCIGTALRSALQVDYEEVDYVLGCDHADIANKKGTLIYLSSWSNQHESMLRPDKYIQNNLTALAKILVNNSFDRVIFPSSPAIYDRFGNLNPSSIYGWTKLVGESLVKMYCQKAWIFRLSNVYGSNDRRSVFYHLAESKKNRRVFTIYRSENMIRDYISSDQVAKLIVEALEGSVETGTYNVGTGKGINMEELLTNLCIKYDIDYQYVDRPDGVMDGFISQDSLIKLGAARVEQDWEKIYL